MKDKGQDTENRTPVQNYTSRLRIESFPTNLPGVWTVGICTRRARVTHVCLFRFQTVVDRIDLPEDPVRELAVYTSSSSHVVTD